MIDKLGSEFAVKMKIRLWACSQNVWQIRLWAWSQNDWQIITQYSCMEHHQFLCHDTTTIVTWTVSETMLLYMLVSRGSHFLCRSVCDWDQNWIKRSKPFLRANHWPRYPLNSENQKDQECMAPIWPFTRKDQGIKHTFCRSKKSWCWLQTLKQATYSHISDYPCCILTSLNCASRHFVQMLALKVRCVPPQLPSVTFDTTLGLF